MAVTRTPNLILTGAQGAFHQAADSIPQVWQKYAMRTQSTTAKETYSFPGFMPIPRVFQDARSIQGFRDFKFDLPNNTYELTIMIDREDLADDQTGTILQRFRELGEVFGTFKDQILADLLANGGSDVALMDNVTFFNTSRTIGDSAAIDNDDTSVAAAGTVPTAIEFMDELALIKAKMWRFEDDQGRVAFNSTAMRDMRIIIPPEFERTLSVAGNSAFLPETAADGATENAFFKGLFQFDVLPYLSGSDAMYTMLLGSTRKPFLYQSREDLEIIIDTDDTNVAERNGVLVLCRERFVMTYGDPRRAHRHVFS